VFSVLCSFVYQGAAPIKHKTLNTITALRRLAVLSGAFLQEQDVSSCADMPASDAHNPRGGFPENRLP